MKKIYTLALSLAMMAAATVSASAEGIHLGYCDGILPSDGMGQSGADATIAGTIRLTPEMLAPYASCQVTSLYVGLTKNASNYPETITGWLRSEKDGENITSGSIAAAGGWLTIQFDAPVNIADYTESGIWAGFEFVQSKKYNILGIGGPTDINDACWVGKNGKWSDFKKYGVLPIEAIIEGESLPQHDLALTACSATPNIVKLGTEIKVSGTIKNNALQEAVNPVVKISYEDKEYTETLDVTLGYRQQTDFIVAMPLSADDTEERNVDVNVEILWSGDITDDYAADNVATLPVIFRTDVFYRKMIVEEATGAWCGFCVRGIVGLRQMKAKYPDTFIGMGVHNGDNYVVKAYDSWIANYIDGYPSCLINRDGHKYDPAPSELEAAMLAMDPISSIGLDLSASYDGQLHISCTVKTLGDMDVNYRLAYVVLEDDLPIHQKNYYSGGGYGPMDGFENMPSECDINIDDVVRAIYPSPYGEEGSVPAQLKRGEPYTHTADVEMCNYVDGDKLSVVAMLIDKTTGQIVNGEKTEYIAGLSTGIQQVEASKGENITFNLNGQRLEAPKSGLNIVNGQVIFIAK